MPDATLTREQAYLKLLHYGLVLLRNFARGKQTELCYIEADHIHNIPSLLHETNEHRHVFYIMKERGMFLKRLRELGATDYLEQLTIWYSEAWWALACVAGVTLDE